MPNYIHYDYNQSSMVVVNFLDQLQPGTFEHAVYYLVDHKLDLSCFDAAFKNEKNGHPAYDPAILLKINLFTHSLGGQYSDRRRIKSLYPEWHRNH